MNQLTHTPEHGHVWHTDCAKCGTRQKIRIGDCTLAEAAAAVEKLDNSPMECPGGYHTELSGWRKRWHLDEMIAALIFKQQSQIEDMARAEAAPVIEAQAEVIPPELPDAESAPSADKTVVHLLTKDEFASLPPDHEWVREVAAYADKVTVGNNFSYGRASTPEGRAQLHRVYLRYKFNSDSSPVPLAVLQSHLLDDEEPCYTSRDWFSREVYAHLAEVNAPAQASPPPPAAPPEPQLSTLNSQLQTPKLLTAGKDGNSRVVAAKNIRLELAHHFPGIKFSVVGDSFSMGDSIDVRWTLGPTRKQVEAIIDRYQECDFDGSDDSTHYRKGAAREFTQAHGGAKYVSAGRDHSEAWTIIGHALCLEHGIEDPEPFDKRHYHSVDIGLPDSAGILANLMLGDTSFPPGATVTGIQLNPNSTDYRTKYMPRFDALNPAAPITSPTPAAKPRKKATLPDAIAASNAKNAPPEDMPTIPHRASLIPHPAATPQGDLIRKIPTGTFAFLSGQPDGAAVRTAFATWVDAGSHTGDWRKLFAEYQTVSLPAPAAAAEAPAPPAAEATPPAAEKRGPWSDWEPGTNVRFIPHDAHGALIIGMLRDLVNDGDGAHIYCPRGTDTSQTLRVWERDGRMEAAPSRYHVLVGKGAMAGVQSLRPEEIEEWGRLCAAINDKHSYEPDRSENPEQERRILVALRQGKRLKVERRFNGAWSHLPEMFTICCGLEGDPGYDIGECRGDYATAAEAQRVIANLEALAATPVPATPPPEEPEEEEPTNILPFTPSTAAAPTAAQLAMERLRIAARRQ